MDLLTDRTAEVESRLRAIKIDGRDGCSFWEARVGTLVNIRQCWYCVYSQFDRENSKVDQKGICKFKR